jgi:plasmid stabilization system protein ParE
MVTLNWSKRALENLDEITKFISKDSAEEAKKFVNQIFLKVQNLIKFPNMGRIVQKLSNII